MNKKHLATAFAVFAATTMSFSAFAATIDANARAYERASAEQYSYPAPQAVRQLTKLVMLQVHRALVTNHCRQCLIQQAIWLNKCLYLKN